MEKNTAWAIGLSTIVLVGFMVTQTILFPAPKKETAEAAVQKTAAEQLPQSVTTDKNHSIIADTSEPVEQEQVYVIKTNKAKITFSNRGGDIIGYELLDHRDRDTGKGIEMADNVSDSNRAFSISLGRSNSKIINDIFTVHQIDQYTIGFYKKFETKNEDGTPGYFTLVKEYSFKPDDYVFKYDILIDGDSSFHGLNSSNVAYTIRTSPQIGPHFDPKVDRYETRMFMSYNGEKKKNTTVGDNQTKSFDKPWKWTGIGGKYFCILVYPSDSATMGHIEYSSAREVKNYANSQIKVERNSIGNGQTHDTYYMYVGPRSEKELVKYNVAEKNPWNLGGTHFNESLPTTGILSWLETCLKFLLEIVYKLIPNWGVAIIIVTVILKMAMFPLTKKSSLGTLKMQQLQPKMTEIQTKFKDNPQKLQEATAKLYKESGYNPMTGCLPMLFQFIILWAMYNLFNNYFEFRGALFIPGWIPDLSTGDHVYTLGFFLPFLGNQIRVLPVIYVISQLLFGKITQNGGTTMAGQSQMQMKMLMYGMPLIFFFIFYNAPSGLLLYWTVSNIIQLGQQLVINKMMKSKMAEIKVVTKSSKKR
jgi:YidC/Oxa1 family membrane protein insertase